MVVDKKIVTFKFGPTDLRVSKDYLTIGAIKQLRKRCREIKQAVIDQFAAREEEFNKIVDKYAESLVKLVDEETKEEESDEAYLDRIKPILEERNEELKVYMDTIPDDEVLEIIAFDILVELAKLSGNQESKVTKENFENCVWKDVKEDLAYLLISNEIPEGTLFLPPKT
jgi:hypothetical protein